MDNYQSRRNFSDRFLPEVKKLVGLAFIREASLSEDKLWATDLVVPNLRISVRIRRSKWLERYGNEFTLRASAPGGLPSEYAKLAQHHPGDAEHLIYCFVDNEDKIIRAWLIDLTKWYYAIINNRVTPMRFKNKDAEEVVSFPCLGEYSKLLVG
jgi:hypothetical protein